MIESPYEGSAKVSFVQTVIFLGLLFQTSALFSQSMTNQQIEEDLHISYQKIITDRYDTTGQSWDKLDVDVRDFRDKFVRYTSTYPSTLTYSFDSLREDNINIVTSDDKLFRIYSWDTWTGGTMVNFENIYQFSAGNKLYSTVNYDTVTNGYHDSYIPFYSQIFTLNASGKTYYLGIYNGIYSTKDASQSVKIFTIENNQLNDTVKLIKTKHAILNSIDVYFDFFSVVDRPERPLQLIKYDEANKILFIPIVYDNGKVTDRFILYKFTGQYFEYIGTQKK